MIIIRIGKKKYRLNTDRLEMVAGPFIGAAAFTLCTWLFMAIFG